ncbi:MAG: cation:proton antiporter [Spirochaetaceae bacterium]|nr:cation:proton antiporter [Spirochaetaceae bacterium]
MNSINEPSGIIAIIMAMAVIAPYISDKFSIPIVATITVAGILLGPQVSGILEPNILMQFMGSLGLLFVFFSAGLEVNLRLVQRHRRQTAVFGAATFLIPFIAGFVFGLALFHQSIKSAILLGAFFASSGTLASHPFQRPDLLGRDSAEVSRGGAGLARIMVVIILFAISAFLPDGNPLSTGRDLLLYGIFFLALILILPRIASLIVKKTRTQGTVDAIFFLFLLYASAYIGFLLGIPGYISAFLAGILIAPYIAASRTTAARLDFLGNSFFVPFLLIFIGASADFSIISSIPALLLLVVGSVVLSIGSKYLAAQFTAKSFGYSKADRGLLFGYSSNYAAFSLAIVSVAGSMGLLDQPLVTGAVLLVVLSSSLTSVAARNSESSILPKASPQASFQNPPKGNRVLVALSKPATAQALMDLGIVIRGQDSTAPVFPLAVISGEVPETENRQYAETMLAAAVMQGASAQVPVIPISHVAVNVAKGILDTAHEQDADTIIIGWNKSPRLSNAFFGSVIDQVISGGNQMVLVARTIEPFSAPHIIVIVPTLCDQHTGFPAAVRALNALARKNQAKVLLMTLTGHGASLAKEFKEKGFSGSLQTLEIDSWKEANQGLRQIPSGKKAFVLFSARPSEPSWHPAIERLPHRVGEEFPEANLLMLYFPSPARLEKEGEEEEQDSLPTSSASADSPRPASSGLARGLSRILQHAVANGTVRVNMQHSAIADGIFELVSSAFPFDRKLSSKFGTRLTENVQRQPIEIEPGVVLLHDRVPGIEEPIVCLGSHRQGFRIAMLEKPVTILILLFVPESEGPEEHLAFLGEIAHLFKEEGLTARLLAADKPEDIL